MENPSLGVLYGAELAAVVCFLIAFQRFAVADVAQRAIQTGLDVSRVMRDPAASDHDKERAARGASLVLLRHFAAIAVRSAAALAVSFLPVFVLQVAGIASISAVNSLMLSWQGIVFASVVAGAMYVGTWRARGAARGLTPQGHVQSRTEK